jgi:hypothetical protein
MLSLGLIEMVLAGQHLAQCGRPYGDTVETDEFAPDIAGHLIGHHLGQLHLGECAVSHVRCTII